MSNPGSGGWQEPSEQYPYPPAPGQPERKGHSGVGIASFILGVLSILVLVGLIVAVAVVEVTNPGAIDSDAEPVTTVLGLVVMLTFLITIIGTTLGVVGLFDTQRNKLFAILGTTFNGMIILAFSAIWAIA